MKECRTCRYWQGHRLQETEADCYRVIAALMPRVLETTKPVFDSSNNLLYFKKFMIPFDPTEFDEWKRYEPFRMEIMLCELPDGVIFDLNDPRFLMTSPDYHCEYYKERK